MARQEGHLCKNCTHATEGGSGGLLICRRYPPVALLTPGRMGPVVQFPFPEMKPDQWCGEFQIQILSSKLN